MEKQSKLTILTLQLLTYMDTVEKKLESIKETGKSGDFFKEVKPFADEVERINDSWRKEAQLWVEKTRPKNIHVQQIDSTHEHINIISVQAFFPETSQTRFRNTVASVKYILNNLLSNLKEEEREP